MKGLGNGVLSQSLCGVGKRADMTVQSDPGPVLSVAWLFLRVRNGKGRCRQTQQYRTARRALTALPADSEGWTSIGGHSTAGFGEGQNTCDRGTVTRSQGRDCSAGRWDLSQIKVKLTQQGLAVQGTLDGPRSVCECLWVRCLSKLAGKEDCPQRS